MQKVLFIAPHLSTGGMPQYLLKILENIKNDFELYVIEYNFLSPLYVVQRNNIINLIGDNHFKSLGNNKFELFNFIEEVNPDIIHMQEIPEMFMHNQLAKKLYNLDCYLIETSHDSGFDVTDGKKFFPDKHLFISDFHPNTYKKLIPDINYDIAEYPVEKKERPDRKKILNKLGLDENKVHILNVGLFTPRKNQEEIIEYAKRLENENIQFHFIGNLAPNFKNYWDSLIQNLPGNVVIWGERNDVDNFYSSMDLFLFTSQGNLNDRETNPLVLKEALSWGMSVFMYNLDVYMGKYNNEENITFLSTDFNENLNKIKQFINQPKNVDNNDLFGDSNYFVTLCTKNYEYLIEYLAQSLYYFSQYKLIVYCLNYGDQKVANLKNFSNIEINYINQDDINIPEYIRDKYNNWAVDRNDVNSYKMLRLKPFILMQFIENYIKNTSKGGVFVDGDMIVNRNIDSIFINKRFLENYPLVSQSSFEYMMVNGKKDIEKSFVDEIGWDYNSDIKRNWYRQSNLFIFDSNCYDFFNEWLDLCNREFILKDVFKHAPFQDETVLNILLWRKQYNKALPQSAMNVLNVNTVHYFYEVGVDDFNKTMDRIHLYKHKDDHSLYTYFAPPYNKNNIKAFHGLKDENELKKIIDYIKNYEQEVEEIKNSIQVSLDGEKNLILIHPTKDLSSNSLNSNNTGVVKDIETNLPMYPAQGVDFKVDWFIVPIQPNVFKFNEYESFKGFYIDFYDENGNKMFSSEEIKIHNFDDNNSVKFYNSDYYDAPYYSYLEIFKDGIYDHFDLSNLDVVVDLGANVGVTSEYFINKGASEIYAVEPMITPYQFMKDNLKVKYGDMVKLRNMAIYGYNGNMKLYTSQTNSEVSTIFPEQAKKHYNEDYKKFNIPCYTLENFCKNEGIDKISLLKIDVEGSEYEIFKSTSKEFFENRVDRLILEFHYNTDEQLKTEILPKLENFSYYIKEQGNSEEGNVSDGSGMLFAYNKSKQKSKQNLFSAAVIDYYYRFDEDEKMLLDTINKFKKYDCDIVLVSHCNRISNEVFNRINYLIYDSDNTFSSIRNYAWIVKNGYKIEYENTKSHAYPVMRSIYNGISFLKDRYDYFYFVEYDSYFDSGDIHKFINQKQDVDDYNKRLWFMKNIRNDGEYKGVGFYETVAFQGYVDDFINIFKNEDIIPYNVSHYEKKTVDIDPLHLEHVFYQFFKEYKDLIYEVFSSQYDFFINSSVNLSGERKIFVSQMFNLNNPSEEKYVVFNTENLGRTLRIFKEENDIYEENVYIGKQDFIILSKNCFKVIDTKYDQYFDLNDNLERNGFYQKLE